jgi:uncharacterized protein (TIGR00251 family)
LSYLKATPEGVRLQIHVQPNASKNQIVGLHGGALKVKIKAVPEDGKANSELIAFLAKTLGVAKSRLELVSGQTSRAKAVLVRDMDVSTARAALKV